VTDLQPAARTAPFDAPPADPLALLQDWIGAAAAAGVPDPATVVLATVDDQGRPSTRTLGLQACDARGLVFFTNLGSRKGRDLAGNPHAAATFYWPQTLQQVNVSGRVEQADDVESDRMWSGRGLAGQVATLVSDQGAPLRDAGVLHERATRLIARGGPTGRPRGHAGLLLLPDTVEFWQGRPDRLHLRLRYQRAGAGWDHWRLQP